MSQVVRFCPGFLFENRQKRSLERAVAVQSGGREKSTARLTLSINLEVIFASLSRRLT